MTFRKFDTGTWQDPWFEDLSPKAKLAFIYFWTNETCNQAGIYEISEKRIKFELGYGIDTIYSELDTKIQWDDTKKIVWVKNFFKRQCQNSKFAISALNSIRDDPYKLKLFIEYNRELLESFTDKNGDPIIDLDQYCIDTISIPYPTEAEAEAEAEQNRTDTYCSELPSEPSEPEQCHHPPIISIQLNCKNGNGERDQYPIYQTDIDEWSESFPAVDVLQEVKKIREWNLSNPHKNKTRNGIRKHITGWLSKAQDKGGNSKSNNPNDGPQYRRL